MGLAESGRVGDTNIVGAQAGIAPLSAQAISQFMGDGYCYVPRAFSAEVASRVLAATLAAARQGGTDPSKPKSPRLIVSRQAGEPFTELNTPMVWSALDQLLGQQRYERSHFEAHGNFLLAFPGFAGPRPECQPLQWHVDNGFRSISHYRLQDGNCGIIPVFALTPMRLHGAPTLIMRGSHRWVARLMKYVGRPITESEMSCFCRAMGRQPMVEAIPLLAEPGDLVLIHPLTIHSASPNASDQLRVICNTGIGQIGARRLDAASDPSVVERAIIEATNMAAPSSVERRHVDRFIEGTGKIWRKRNKMIGAIGVDTRQVGRLKRAAIGALDLLADPMVRRVADAVVPEP